MLTRSNVWQINILLAYNLTKNGGIVVGDRGLLVEDKCNLTVLFNDTVPSDSYIYIIVFKLCIYGSLSCFLNTVILLKNSLPISKKIQCVSIRTVKW